MNARSQHGPGAVRTIGDFSVRVSNAAGDPIWDDFVEQTQGSAYPQTSCWGRVRVSAGWQPVRVVVSEDGRVVAGVQMLTRPLPIGGNVGIVPRGPLVPQERADLIKIVFDEMMALGRASKVLYLVAYAPRGGDWMCEELMRRGLRPTDQEFEYTATTYVDLRPDLDSMLAGMKKKTRQHIRNATKKQAITVRHGSEVDLPIFNMLKDAHAARLGYSRRDEHYYEGMWHALAPRGHVTLFIAEYDGEPLSAQLAIPFGDTCYHMERPWSGRHSKLDPNELLEWEVMKWAKAEGYETTDHVGIARPAAEAILAGEPNPPGLRTAEYFKLGFGGEVTLLPKGYDHIYNPVLRFAYRTIPRRTLPSIMRFVDRMRARLWGRRQS